MTGTSTPAPNSGGVGGSGRNGVSNGNAANGAHVMAMTEDDRSHLLEVLGGGNYLSSDTGDSTGDEVR